MKPSMTAKGRPTVVLTIQGKQTNRSVPGLVLRAWVGPRPLGFEAFRFPDLDPENNRVENLRWAEKGTSLVGSGVVPPQNFGRGEDHPGARLDPEKVRLARRLYLAGNAPSEIAEKLGVHCATIQLAIKGKTWAHVADPGPVPLANGARLARESSPRTRIDQEMADEIRSLSASGISIREIAERFALPRSLVSKVIHNHIWKA